MLDLDKAEVRYTNRNEAKAVSTDAAHKPGADLRFKLKLLGTLLLGVYNVKRPLRVRANVLQKPYSNSRKQITVRKYPK